VKLNEVEPFSGTLAAPNALMITGGATTVMLAFEVLPVPPSVEIICTLLFFTPDVVPWTVIDTTHAALVAMFPAERLTCPEPGTAVTGPPQELVKLLGLATTRPAGRLSVKATPVSATPTFGFVMLKVNEVVPFSGIEAKPNALVIVGGVTTVKLAVAVLPVPPFVELTAPVVFVKFPDAVPVTLT